MKEYFNIDVENNLELKTPQEIRKNEEDKGMIVAKYMNDNKVESLITMTPPLRCSNIRVWEGGKYNYSKCELELELTENEWRFCQFLSDISSKSKHIITNNSKKWFKYTFSTSYMRDSYSNLFVNKQYRENEREKIKIQISKNLLKTLDKKTAKSYKNQYLVLRIMFKGILVSDGVFTEVWRADQVFKAVSNFESDDSEYENENDIGEICKDNSVVENEEDVKEVKPVVEKEIKEVKPVVEEEIKEVKSVDEEEIKEVKSVDEEEVKPVVEEEVKPVVEEVKEVKSVVEEVVEEDKLENLELKEIIITPKIKKNKKKKIILSNNRRRKL